MTLDWAAIREYLKKISTEGVFGKGIILCDPKERTPVTTVIQSVVWVKRIYVEEDSFELQRLKYKRKQIMIKHFGSENPDILNCQKSGFVRVAWSSYREITQEIDEQIKQLVHSQDLLGNSCATVRYEHLPEFYFANICDRVVYKDYFCDETLEAWKNYMYFGADDYPKTLDLHKFGIKSDD